MDAKGERERLEELLADPDVRAEGDRRRLERDLYEQRRLLGETDPHDHWRREELRSSIEELEQALRRLDKAAAAPADDLPYGMHRDHPAPGVADWIRQNTEDK